MGRFKEQAIRAAEALQASKGTRTPLRQREGPAGRFSVALWPFYDEREPGQGRYIIDQYFGVHPLQDRPKEPGAQCDGSVDA